MSDLDKVVAFLRVHVNEAKIITLLEKSAPKWDNRCILDMINEGRVEEVLNDLAKVFD